MEDAKNRDHFGLIDRIASEAIERALKNEVQWLAYFRATRACEAFHVALCAEYGSSNAGDARYLPTHAHPPRVRQACNWFLLCKWAKDEISGYRHG